MRNEEAGWSTMFGRELGAVELERDPRLAVEKILQRKIGRITAVAVNKGEVRRAVDPSEEMVERHSSPRGV